MAGRPFTATFHTFFLSALASILLAASALPAPTNASVRLNVPFHRQEQSLSCEIATLKMALAAHGINVSERELIQQLPFDPTPKSRGVWGDPNKGFVGRIDGRMLVDGYGVYWDPIASVGSNYAATRVIHHGSAADIAGQLAQGHPVIIWGYYGQRAVYNWQTPDGNTIKAVNGEHTRVVYGFDGPTDNPTRFYLIDPLSGHMSWSTDELMFNWSALNHMAVAIAPPRDWVRVAGEVDVWEIDPTTNTRHLIPTWAHFESRGGSPHAIKTITNQELLQYRIGGTIE